MSSKSKSLNKSKAPPCDQRHLNNKGVKQFFMEKYYIINQYMMYREGRYNEYGKLCTKVTQTDQTFLVDRSPMTILEDSIKCIGFNLKGAMSTAKWILGNTSMCPVMVNPIKRICVFPHKSAKKADAMWFNPTHIMKTTSLYRNTNVQFSNGLCIKVPMRLSSFNTKLATAEQLRDITVGIGNNPDFLQH